MLYHQVMSQTVQVTIIYYLTNKFKTSKYDLTFMVVLNSILADILDTLCFDTG